MKKYDKITSRRAARAYLNMVDNSYLGSSDEVTKLMERVEATFIKHFSNSNRHKGINILRPQAKRERHRITFSMGFFAGATTALIVALILIIRARRILNMPGSTHDCPFNLGGLRVELTSVSLGLKCLIAMTCIELNLNQMTLGSTKLTVLLVVVVIVYYLCLCLQPHTPTRVEKSKGSSRLIIGLRSNISEIFPCLRKFSEVAQK